MDRYYSLYVNIPRIDYKKADYDQLLGNFNNRMETKYALILADSKATENKGMVPNMTGLNH